jgi:hypothetical protein
VVILFENTFSAAGLHRTFLITFLGIFTEKRAQMDSAHATLGDHSERRDRAGISRSTYRRVHVLFKSLARGNEDTKLFFFLSTLSDCASIDLVRR